MDEFVLQISEVKRRAREHMEKGAVTPTYKGNREDVLKILNEALATELICIMRYKRHYYTSDGIHSEAVKAEFLEHAHDEAEHADWIADRIIQLDGEPNYNPVGLTERASTDYVECDNLIDMIKENLVAERIAIEVYDEMIRYIGENDPTTRRMLERILAQEEDHADDMATLLKRLDVGPGPYQLRAEREKSSSHGPVEPGTTIYPEGQTGKPAVRLAVGAEEDKP
jgi:bacterioferritin